MKYLSPFTYPKNYNLWNLSSTFDDLFNEVATPALLNKKGTLGFSATDIEETEKGFLVSMDLPGMKEEEIKVDFADHVLKISGERKRETKSEDGSYLERSHGSFSRSFSLPENIKSEAISAHYENGVLKIEIPKNELASPKSFKINVNSAKQVEA